MPTPATGGPRPWFLPNPNDLNGLTCGLRSNGLRVERLTGEPTRLRSPRQSHHLLVAPASPLRFVRYRSEYFGRNTNKAVCWFPGTVVSYRG